MARAKPIAQRLRRLATCVGGVNLATLGRLMRFGPGDAAWHAAASCQAAEPFGRTRRYSPVLSRMPVVSVGKLISRKPTITLDCRYVDVDGSLSLYELLRLLMLARDQEPRGILEIGTYFGSTTINLALNLPDAAIHTIDLPPGVGTDAAALPADDAHLIRGRQLGTAFAGTPQAARITQHLGDTAAYDFSAIGDPLSFFFIDGSHTYEYARSDTLRCLAVARGPSTFLWHDCDAAHPGVVRWLGQMLEAGVDVSRLASTSMAHARIDPADGQTLRYLAQLPATA